MKIDKENKEKNELLMNISPHVFWNCDVRLYNWKDQKKSIIERVIEKGKPCDEEILFKMYSIKDIKKIAITIEGLYPEKIEYWSKLLRISRKKFKNYNKKPWYEYNYGESFT